MILNNRAFGPNKCKPLRAHVRRCRTFFVQVTVNTETDVKAEPEDAIFVSLQDRFSSPVYFWDLNLKRAFLLLGVLSKWNPQMGAIYQDQLIMMTGLDMGLEYKSEYPNALRALTIAINRKHSIKLRAQGNGPNRSYRFSTTSLREAVVRYMDLPRSEKIYLHLRKESDQARTRREW